MRGISVIMIAIGLIPDLFHERETDPSEPPSEPGPEDGIKDLLDALDDTYHVMHDIETPGGNIGHIVISRNAGVFLIEADSFSGDATIRDEALQEGGFQAEPRLIDQCMDKSHWLRDRIGEIIGEKPWITSLLVVPDGYVPEKPKIEGIRVIARPTLLPTLSENGGRRRKSARLWEARELIADSLLG